MVFFFLQQIIRGQCGFRADLQFEEPSPMQNNDIKTNDHREPYYLPNYQVNQQWNGGKTEIPTINKRPHKHHRHHKPLTHYDLSEDVQVIDDQVERIHMPSFKDFRDTMILHDFQKVRQSSYDTCVTCWVFFVMQKKKKLMDRTIHLIDSNLKNTKS